MGYNTPLYTGFRSIYLPPVIQKRIKLIYMINLLKHKSILKPFYIALSDDQRFHALYSDVSVGSSNSVGGAIASIPNKFLYGVSNNILDWERL